MDNRDIMKKKKENLLHLHTVKIKTNATFFIRYKSHEKIKHLCTQFPKVDKYVNSIKKTKNSMSFEAKK